MNKLTNAEWKAQMTKVLEAQRKAEAMRKKRVFGIRQDAHMKGKIKE